MIVYSGRVESRDANRLFDAISSLVDHGDLLLDLSAWENPPTTLIQAFFPLEPAGVEPMQVAAAAPLYALARLVPGIGLAHTVYLFNVFVTAAAGVFVAVFARGRGYRVSTAWAAALIFGAATAVFPYSKSLFREPLALSTLLSTAYFVDRLRASGYRQVALFIGLGLSLAAMILTKASSLLALPALVVLALPPLGRFDRRRFVAVLGLIVLLMVLLLGMLAIFGDALGLAGRYAIIGRTINASSVSLWAALHGYLLSIGGSVWGTSPILLLAIPGAVLLVRQGEIRWPLAVVLLVVGFAVGYAVLNARFWFGGLSWPPRFLLPVIPIALMLTLPVIERAVGRSRPVWLIALIVLVAYGIAINLSGVTLDWEAYSRALPAASGGVGEWWDGLNVIRWLRWTVTPTLWEREPLDIAWAVIDTSFMMIAFGLLAVVALIVGVARMANRVRTIGVIGLSAVWIVLTGYGLTLLGANDLRYRADDEAMRAMLPVLEDRTERDDVIVLSSPRYVPFFLNYGDLDEAGRVIALELQPGERVSEVEPPRVTSDYPPALLTKETYRLLTNLALTRDRVFALVDGGPDLAWMTRPVERFLATTYYPIGVTQTGPLARLVEFSTVLAPDPFGFRNAAYPTDLRFGDSIRLNGLTLPLPMGETYQAGDVVAVSSVWTTDAPLVERYTIGLYLRAADGTAIAQMDGPPGFGFAPTDAWIPNVPVWDNRAIVLPDDLPDGAYELWMKVYSFAPDGAVRDLPVTSNRAHGVVDEAIGVLPVIIRVGGS